jgi:hypothetical protein
MASVPSMKSVWTGRVLSRLAIIALALDALAKIIVPQMMIDNSPPLGIAGDIGLYRTIGAILLVSLLLHVWPRTAFLGTLLVTAFLGGAVAVNLRAGMPLFSNTLFGAYIGPIFWAGLWLRDARIRALLHG